MAATRTSIIKNGDRLVIRGARPTDAAAMISFVNMVAGESDNMTFGEGEFNISVEEEIKMIGEMLNSNNQLFLIAEIDGRIVGNLIFRAGKRPRIAHSGEFGISVLKEYWGLGIGRLLMEYLLDWAREGGIIRKINLRVRSDNKRGIVLYKSMGFQEEGLLRSEMIINGKFYDFLAMGIIIND